MKKLRYFVILISIIYCCSCSNTQESKIEHEELDMQENNIKCEEFNVQENIKECKINIDLPEGFFLGEIIEYKGKDTMEKNMLNQFNSYSSALFRGDYKNACHYQYKDAVKYFKKFYPNETDEEIMRKFFAPISEEMIQAIKSYEQYGIKLNIVVSRIIRKVTQEENIIYVLEIVSNMIDHKVQMHTTPERILAISNDSGENWTFNTVNEDTPDILLLSFTNNVVNKVMK